MVGSSRSSTSQFRSTGSSSGDGMGMEPAAGSWRRPSLCGAAMEGWGGGCEYDGVMMGGGGERPAPLLSRGARAKNNPWVRVLPQVGAARNCCGA